MKTLFLLVGVLFFTGCSSSQPYEKLNEGAANCNAICKSNPEITEYSHKAGGGLTLLFMGGKEEKCVCARTGN